MFYKHLSAVAITSSAIAFMGCIEESDEYDLQPHRTNKASVLGGFELDESTHKIDLQNCSGTALSNEWVLTAAHCINRFFDYGFGALGLVAATGTGGLGKLQFNDLEDREITGIGLDWQGRTIASISDSSGVLRVARYLNDGNLDLSFGANGAFTFSALDSSPSDLVITTNGSVFVSGTVESQGTSRMAVWKLNPDGTLDTSFGNGGLSIPNFAGFSSERGDSIDLDSMGRVVLGGTVYWSPGTSSEYVLSRMDPGTGLLDSSFNFDGRVIIDIQSSALNETDEIGVDLYDDSIYLVGTSRIAGTDQHTVVSKTLSTGMPDFSFDQDGHAVLDFGSGSTSISGGISVDFDSGDVIVASTVLTPGGQQNFGAQRIEWQQFGALKLDPAFGSKLYPRPSWIEPVLNDVSRAGIGTNRFNGPITFVGSVTTMDNTAQNSNHYHTKLVHAFVRIDPNSGAPVPSTMGFENHTYRFGVASEEHANKAITHFDERTTIAGHMRIERSGNNESSLARLSANFEAFPLQTGAEPVKVGGTNKAIFSDYAYLHPVLDIGLLHMPKPLVLDGSTSGHDQDIFAGPATDLLGSQVICYGYGLNSEEGAGLGLTIIDYDSLDREYRMSTGTSDQGLCNEDSGSGCFTSDGVLVGVYTAALHDLDSCSTNDNFTVSSQSFRTWVYDKMAMHDP